MIWTTAKSTEVSRPQTAVPSRANGPGAGRAALRTAIVAMTASYPVGAGIELPA